jgi:hypothetical protein
MTFFLGLLQNGCLPRMILSGIHDFSVLKTGFRLKAYRNDNFFGGFCKRLGFSCLSKVTELMELSADFALIFAKFVIFFISIKQRSRHNFCARSAGPLGRLQGFSGGILILFIG